MKNLLIIITALGSLSVWAGTAYVPSVSEYSFSEARQGCLRASSVTGLPAGRTTGYPLRTDGGLYVVVCERELRDYQNLFPRQGFTFVPSTSLSSYEEARNGCLRASGTTGLPAGRAIGYSLFYRDTYIVVCKRPLNQ